jgi:hypothetical protein
MTIAAQIAVLQCIERQQSGHVYTRGCALQKFLLKMWFFGGAIFRHRAAPQIIASADNKTTPSMNSCVVSATSDGDLTNNRKGAKGGI